MWNGSTIRGSVSRRSSSYGWAWSEKFVAVEFPRTYLVLQVLQLRKSGYALSFVILRARRRRRCCL